MCRVVPCRALSGLHESDGVVSCCVMLCCVVLCCVMLCCVVLCCVMLCCVVLCCAVLCCVVLCCVVLCCVVLCCVVLCCVVQGGVGTQKDELITCLYVCAEWVSVVHFCNSWWIFWLGGGVPPGPLNPLPWSPAPSALRSINALPPPPPPSAAGAGLCGGTFSPRDISRFEFVPHCPHAFQAGPAKPEINK